MFGKSEPAVVGSSIDRSLCAPHVKFMYCAALTKEPRTGFWGKIMPEQREDGTEEKQDARENDRTEQKVNLPLRREKGK